MNKLFKRIIGHIAYFIKIWKFCFIIYKKVTGRNILVVFTYHRITGREKTKHFFTNYDKGLDKEIFATQIKAICQYFDVITLNEFIGFITGEKQLTRHSALLTFDDADSDFMEYAYPILSDYNIKATIFVPTGLVETGNSLWHLQVSNIFLNINKESWLKILNNADYLPDGIKQIVKSSSIDDKERLSKTCQNLINNLDKLDISEIEKIIERWEELVASDYNLGIKCLDWEQLRALSNEGFDIESHSATHRKLTQINSDQLPTELLNSKRKIEQELRKTVKSICYPAGFLNNDVINVATHSGYRIGFTTISELCQYPLQGDELFRIPRLTIYGDTEKSIDLFMGKIAIKAFLSRSAKKLTIF